MVGMADKTIDPVFDNLEVQYKQTCAAVAKLEKAAKYHQSAIICASLADRSFWVTPPALKPCVLPSAATMGALTQAKSVGSALPLPISSGKGPPRAIGALEMRLGGAGLQELERTFPADDRQVEFELPAVLLMCCMPSAVDTRQFAGNPALRTSRGGRAPKCEAKIREFLRQPS